MIISIIIFVITLLILVLIHEFGHFIMAKRFGVKVEEFGFGIPPRIWGKKIGETLYSINWLPFGGFVKLLGEDGENKAAAKNPGSFASQVVWKRILIVVSGVIMNLLLAWVIFYTVIIYQNFRIIYPTLQPGVYIGHLESGLPAEKAGIRIGDKILKVDEREIKKFEDARNFIKEKKGEALTLALADIDGKNQKLLTITPQPVEGGDFLIGVGFSPLAIKQYLHLDEKLFSAVTYSWHLTRITFTGLGKLIYDLSIGNFQSASQSVSGPVGLANVSSEILSSGTQALPFYLWFVGVISLTLSIFNVLPIPALDGGRLLFLMVEALSRRKVKQEVERLVHQIGFALLLALALLITYSDIRKILP